MQPVKRESAPSNAVTCRYHVPAQRRLVVRPLSACAEQVTYTITVTNPQRSQVPGKRNFPHVSPSRTASPPAVLRGNGGGYHYHTTRTDEQTASVTVPGVADPSFNGTFPSVTFLRQPRWSFCGSDRYRRFRNCHRSAACQHRACANQPGHLLCWRSGRYHRNLQPGFLSCWSYVHHDGDRADPEPGYP